jgi:aminotransferase
VFACSSCAGLVGIEASNDSSIPIAPALLEHLEHASAVENKLNQKLEHRQILKERYKKNLSRMEQISVFRENLNCEIDSAYIMPVQVLRERDGLAVFLKEKGIYTTFRYFPLHHVEYYKASIETPVTDVFAKQLLLLPLHNGLEIIDIDFICERIEEFYLG